MKQRLSQTADADKAITASEKKRNKEILRNRGGEYFIGTGVLANKSLKQKMVRHVMCMRCLPHDVLQSSGRLDNVWNIGCLFKIRSIKDAIVTRWNTSLYNVR